MRLSSTSRWRQGNCRPEARCPRSRDLTPPPQLAEKRSQLQVETENRAKNDDIPPAPQLLPITSWPTPAQSMGTNSHQAQFNALFPQIPPSWGYPAYPSGNTTVVGAPPAMPPPHYYGLYAATAAAGWPFSGDQISAQRHSLSHQPIANAAAIVKDEK